MPLKYGIPSIGWISISGPLGCFNTISCYGSNQGPITLLQSNFQPITPVSYRGPSRGGALVSPALRVSYSNTGERSIPNKDAAPCPWGN